MRMIPGFDYVAQKAVTLTTAQWKARMVGMRRRHQSGETFIHQAKGAKIVAEIYGNVQTPS